MCPDFKNLVYNVDERVSVIELENLERIGAIFAPIQDFLEWLMVERQKVLNRSTERDYESLILILAQEFLTIFVEVI